MIKRLLTLFMFTALAVFAKPNIVFILADDLAYGCVGFNGSEKIKTPELDRMAKEGLRLDAMYASCSVCGPSRASLMFGQHLGHCKIRGNPKWSLKAKQGKGPVNIQLTDRLMPAYLKDAGYATGCFGKWGLNDSLKQNGGQPNQHGFDEFWGFNTHLEAHYHWPDFVWHNEEKIELGADGKNWREKRVYGDALFTDKCIEFMKAQTADGQPFFAYLALTAPHLGNAVPAEYREMYAGEGWPHIKGNEGHYRNDDGQNEAYAGMVTHSDAMVGRVRAALEKLCIEKNTLVIFTSDNGQEWGKKFFNQNSPYRGGKRSLNEGGIRMPTVVWWPETVAAGRSSDLPVAFWDILPTFCELAGAAAPERTDGLSMVPLLTGEGKQKKHEYLFWYFNEGNGPMVAVRFGEWKAIKTWDKKKGGFRPVQLYDLAKDPGEETDRAAQYPEIVRQAERYMDDAWTDDPNYPQVLLTAKGTGK
ncbi:arylsulfatase [Pontiella sp.]|uniref:arylsulfatase n=1 Tax=Pontiella sp. TaxID=2837462 RepID=UPI00356A629A